MALGSNQRHPRLGAPRGVVAAAMDLMDGDLGEVVARSPIVTSAPVGPSLRTYANAAVVLDSELAPHDLLRALQGLEADLGRTRQGQRWRARTIDLDVVLWSGGIVATSDLAVPHPLFRTRRFVLGPASAIAPDWRDPITGLTLRHLHARLTRPGRLPR
ncbi:2-amino-4-hydroxy-6-hydroxymethyldihydropteridine diphosphokinase [Aurantiacibacter arachoides]|uniref:2-amino-4-hydroxy-6- hydroxymethyldihydropteridine diphosphokinase n=1 Tax=Aurantiacibacter arachoides TaxID=1850444 RepID=UPI001F187A52|nr:2-amino-4-hydroxy-6-hydroxymethyldihydropteridine diphosphokinase [Aurantiacibacter arachoides]